MGKGGLKKMKTEIKLSASSKPEKYKKSLEKLATQWGINLDIKISKPYIYTKSSIIRTIKND